MLRKYMWDRGTCGVEEQRTHGGGADVQGEDVGMSGGWPCLCLCFWPRLCELLCAGGGLCHVIRTSMPDRVQMWRICAVFFGFPSRASGRPQAPSKPPGRPQGSPLQYDEAACRGVLSFMRQQSAKWRLSFSITGAGKRGMTVSFVIFSSLLNAILSSIDFHALRMYNKW